MNHHLPLFLANFFGIAMFIFHKSEIQMAFFDAEQVCSLIGSLAMAWKAKISVSGFYQFCKKKTCENIAVIFLQFILGWEW